MKKKFSIWLNIVTICLCVCAIAIGVYAATSATLQVTGQIGFTAHGCDIDASGYIYGHAVTDGNGAETGSQPAPTNDSEKVKLTASGSDSTPNVAEVRGSNAQTLSIGTKNFTDMNDDATGKPTDITIVLNLTNQSLFNVYGVVSATSTNKNIGIEQSPGLFNLGVKDSAKSSVDVTITLSVIPDKDGVYQDIKDATDNVQISIDFNKGTIEENLIKKDTAKGYYYVEMGEYEGTPLRWYAFAYKGTEATTYGSASTTAVTNLSSGSYYFISEKALLVDSDRNGVAFNTNGYQETATHYGLDYAYESTIRPLVNDGADNENSIYSTYGMSNSPIYKAITNRTLAGEEYTNPDGETGTTHTTYNQTLWLLGHGEEINWLAGKTVSDWTEITELKTHPVGGAENNYTGWLLRSPIDASTNDPIDPSSNGAATVWYVTVDGEVIRTFVNNGTPGVRPAFQIDIAV